MKTSVFESNRDGAITLRLADSLPLEPSVVGAMSPGDCVVHGKEKTTPPSMLVMGDDRELTEVEWYWDRKAKMWLSLPYVTYAYLWYAHCDSLPASDQPQQLIPQ